MATDYDSHYYCLYSLQSSIYYKINHFTLESQEDSHLFRLLYFIFTIYITDRSCVESKVFNCYNRKCVLDNTKQKGVF